MADTSAVSLDRITELLGDDADSLLNHESQTISREDLHLPGPDFVDRVLSATDRSNRVRPTVHRY